MDAVRAVCGVMFFYVALLGVVLPKNCENRPILAAKIEKNSGFLRVCGDFCVKYALFCRVFVGFIRIFAKILLI